MLANYARAVGRKSCTKPTKSSSAAPTVDVEQHVNDYLNGKGAPGAQGLLDLLEALYMASTGQPLPEPPDDYQPSIRRDDQKPAEPADAPPLSFAKLSPAQQRYIRMVADLDSRNVEGRYNGATVTTARLLTDGGWLWYGGQPAMKRLTDAAWDALERHDTGQPEPVGAVGLRPSDSLRSRIQAAAHALPVDLLPQFRALPFAEQTTVRASAWLLGQGGIAEQVGHWLLSTIEANPDIDEKTLETYWREWVQPGVNGGRPYPFGNGVENGNAWTLFFWATGHSKPHKRRKLEAADRDACLLALADALSVTADD